MTTLTRYTLLQIPDALVVGLLLVTATRWQRIDLSPWIAVLLGIAWIVKDIVLYPRLKRAYGADALTGTERLIGRRAVVHRALEPVGLVKIDGDLWRAQAIEEGPTFMSGAVVEVRQAEGLTLGVIGWRDDT